MSYEDASALVPQVPAMRAIHTRAAMLADGEDPALADVGALIRMAMPETQRLPQLQLKAYLDAMQALGVEPDATAATVPATTVVRSRKRLRAALDEFDAASANHAAVAKRAAPAIKGAAALISDHKRLAAMLSHYGRTVRSERRQAKGVRDTSLVIAADERFDAYAGVAEFDTHADRGRVHEHMDVVEDAV